MSLSGLKRVIFDVFRPIYTDDPLANLMQADAMVALVLAVVDDFQVIFMVGWKFQVFCRLGQIELISR